MSRAPHETTNAGFRTGDVQYPPQSAQNQEPHGVSNFVDGSGPIFSMYMEMSTGEDKRAENWKADADAILIFTGLFSAAVASLISVSIQDIRPNPQDTSNFCLANIYKTIADPNISTSLPSSPPPFSPPTYALWVNSLWFLSLVISLTCALLAALLQQWARRYLKVTQSRSRISTTLFRDIVRDMDVLLIPYGNLRQHSNEETRSRFFAPIVNRLTALFGSWIRNTSEPLMSDRITKRGRVECYFKTFNAAVSVVLVEATWNIGDGKERLNAIAQVIAECDACNWNNRKDSFNIPVYGILCDGCSFQFFTFDGNVTLSKFTMGTFPGSTFRGLKLVDFSSKPTARPFIHSLRPICETIFSLLLLTFIASVKAFRDRFASQQKSLDGWDRALKFAEEALEMSQTAEELRQENSTDTADAMAGAAIKALKLSTDEVPISRKYISPPLMDGWDDDEVRKV